MNEQLTFPVEAVHVMMFARAVGSPDAQMSSGGPTLAPPTFTEARQQFVPDYEWRPRTDRPWVGSASDATGMETSPLEGVVLHAEQHFEYRRPVVVGDLLTVSTRPGRAWEKTSRRGHRLSFRERVDEFVDVDGDIVVISTVVEVSTVTGAPSS
jgi:peroxisomal enoyl-CoA hydratase 2